jgi:hemolysin activation/secretion protein
MKHVLHTSHCVIKRIELEGRRLRVVERRLDFTALEREVYATAKVYVDKELSEEKTRDVYDSLTNFLQYPGDFEYLYRRFTSEKTE